MSLDERIKLVGDLWDSIAADQKALQLTTEQKAELDRRLDASAVDGNRGRLAADVVAEIRRRLDDDGALVVAVLHGGRHPDHWKHRT